MHKEVTIDDMKNMEVLENIENTENNCFNLDSTNHNYCINTKNMLLYQTDDSKLITDVKINSKYQSHCTFQNKNKHHQIMPTKNQSFKQTINLNPKSLDNNHSSSNDCFYNNFLRIGWMYFEFVQKQHHCIFAMALLLSLLIMEMMPRPQFASAAVIKNDNNEEHNQHLLISPKHIVFEKYSQDRENSLELMPLSKIDTTQSINVTTPLTTTVVNNLMNNITNSTTANSTSTSTAVPPVPCEPIVLDENIPNPLYDVSDITEEAAKQFAEFLNSKSLPSSSSSSSASAGSSSENYFHQTRQSYQQQQQQQHSSNSKPPSLDDIRKTADQLANTALSQDENLLAFALASPNIHIAVVRFRDNVTIPPQETHSKAFLAPYWRELGLAWNSTENAQSWGSPFRDCNAIQGRWLWPFRMSLTEFGHKIVATAFIAADVDLCNDDLVQIFGRKHGCDRETTFCLLTEYQQSSTRNVYTCLCKDSFYLPNSTLQGFKAEQVENISGKSSDIDANFSCIPCPNGCFSCDQYGTCLLLGGDQFDVSFETVFKVAISISLGACMFCCIALSVFVFRQRKCKAIATGMWTVLEHILLGILLLYISVALHFLPASTLRCLLEPWCREIGFMTCYGAIILKLYRHLVEFRTRKAHRWVLRDVDLLKYLFTMVFAVICYMSAFTASSLDLIENASMIGLQESQTNTCVSLKWEYVTQASEILILCFGLHLAFACRNATTQFRERQFLVAALTIEFIVSASFYTLRIIYLQELSPGAIFLALFIRSQLTNTVTLGLIFFPKLWYQHKQVRSLDNDQSLRLPVDAFKGSHEAGHHLGGGYAGLCLGDPDIGELTISEMSPEDIRAELKRLYTQLELMKNKTLRHDNPHISKRRGGRKAGHRRFSLQKKGSKDKSLNAKHRNKHHDIEITEAEPSRTPEDSVCSVEGPTDIGAEASGVSHSMHSHSVVSHSK